MFGKLVRVTVLYLLLLLTWVKCLSIAKANATFDESTSISIKNSDLYEESRKSKKKHSYLFGLILGAVLCKLVLFPVAVKAMAIMSSVSVLLSAMSLIISSIVGYAKLAASNIVKVVHVKDVWSKGDQPPLAYIQPPDGHNNNNSGPEELNQRLN
ncbi:hypothetical protein HUJ05_008056 [Dendroctonus ponderosae]|nr:hypothetical protein HUJ05_008056 [Dendroctonus ponderosae]